MSNFIRINKKKFSVLGDEKEDAIVQGLVEKSTEHKMTLEQVIVQSIAQEWLRNEKFRKSNKADLAVLLSFAFEFGYNEMKIANGRVKIISIDHERRALVNPEYLERK